MPTHDDERAARLKAALRDNLRRRKTQARGRAAEPDPAEIDSARSGTQEDAQPPRRDR